VNQREVISGRREDGRGEEGRRDHENGDGHIELAAGDHEEPTWEVRVPASRRRRLDRRTRAILIVAAVAAVAVNASAAWAYWHITDSSTSTVVPGTAVELTLPARSDLNKPLAAGSIGNLTVTVTNENDFPVRIKRVGLGGGNIVADDEHREAGCIATGVELTRTGFDVSWDVPKNTIGAFLVPDGLSMRADANPKCAGAVFTVPVQLTGYRIDNS
jgi:hypothetical protein